MSDTTTPMISRSRAKLVARELNSYRSGYQANGMGVGMCLIFNAPGTRSVYVQQNTDTSELFGGVSVRIDLGSNRHWTAEDVAEVWATAARRQEW